MSRKRTPRDPSRRQRELDEADVWIRTITDMATRRQRNGGLAGVRMLRSVIVRLARVETRVRRVEESLVHLSTLPDRVLQIEGRIGGDQSATVRRTAIETSRRLRRLSLNLGFAVRFLADLLSEHGRQEDAEAMLSAFGFGKPTAVSPPTDEGARHDRKDQTETREESAAEAGEGD